MYINAFLNTIVTAINHVAGNIASKTFPPNYWTDTNRRTFRIFFSQTENLCIEQQKMDKIIFLF